MINPLSNGPWFTSKIHLDFYHEINHQIDNDFKTEVDEILSINPTPIIHFESAENNESAAHQ